MLYRNILFLIISCHQATAFFMIPFSDLKAIAEFAMDVYEKFDKVYGFYKDQTGPEEIKMDDILKEVRDVSSKVEELGHKIERQIDQAVQTLLQRLPLDAKIDAKKRDLHNAIVRIDGLFDNFVTYTTKKENFNNHTINSFIKTVTSHNANDLEHSLLKIHRLFVPQRTASISESLFSLLNEQSKVAALETCDTGNTPQQELYQLYTLIVKTEMRGFLMSSFSYMLLSVYNKVSYQGALKKAERQLIERSKELMAAVKAEMKLAPKYIRRCDPPSFSRGDNYLEFFQFIQGYVANEKTLNSEESCKYTCSTLSNPARQENCWSRDPYFCPQSSCHGKVYDCKYGGPNKWELCTHSSGPRRYTYFIDGFGDTHGEKEKCTGYTKYPKYFREWWIYDCDFCICTCVDDAVTSPSRRIISLRPQVSDVEKNMVVTGVKLVDKDKMIHVQIKQGILEPEGRIQRGSESWKDLESFIFLDNMTILTRQEYIVKARQTPSGVQYDQINYGSDFTVLKYEQKQIHLDDLLAPKDYVVTGIKFQHPTVPIRSENQPIQIAIHVTPFNYTSGQLLSISKGRWITSGNMENPPKEYSRNRNKFDMSDRVRIPTKSTPNLPDSEPNSYVEFRASGLREDAAQSTIPFLDSQPIDGKPSFALGGVGLFHKGYKTYGGFLAFRLISLELLDYMNESVPDKLILEAPFDPDMNELSFTGEAISNVEN